MCGCVSCIQGKKSSGTPLAMWTVHTSMRKIAFGWGSSLSSGCCNLILARYGSRVSRTHYECMHQIQCVQFKSDFEDVPLWLCHASSNDVCHHAHCRVIDGALGWRYDTPIKSCKCVWSGLSFDTQLLKPKDLWVHSSVFCCTKEASKVSAVYFTRSFVPPYCKVCRFILLSRQRPCQVRECSLTWCRSASSLLCEERVRECIAPMRSDLFSLGPVLISVIYFCSDTLWDYHKCIVLFYPRTYR